MKKIISTILVCVLLVGSIFALASCSNISESYADKINKAAEKDEHYSYEQVLKDLGENAIEISLLQNGVIVAVQGCDDVEDIIAKIDAGEDVKGIVVTMVLGKATGAVYKSISKDDLK